jgi:hypothetical protein
MNHVKASGALLCALALAMPFAANAQERGRTDGPEGSEYGKGGYDSPNTGKVSLQLDWGAAVATPVNIGTPLFLGLTGGYWMGDWMALEATGLYIFSNSGAFEAMVGPRFRTGSYPVGFSLGVKGGAFIPSAGVVRFLLSPQVGADVMINRNLLLGLNYALDLPIGSGGVIHRVYMNVGYRF